MEEELPSEFDLIVVGTGFSESVVAAAASRIGKTVLHVDPNEFYGGVWASFNLEALQRFLSNCSQFEEHNPNDDSVGLRNDEREPHEQQNHHSHTLKNVQQKWHFTENVNNSKEEPIKEHDSNRSEDEIQVKEEDINETREKFSWTKEKILKDFRRFNIDLSPKLLFSGGKLVELLISSNICRYAEFRPVDKVCSIVDGKIKSVPCSRTDVFNSKDLTVIEKRLIMKVLTNCMNHDANLEEFSKYQGKNFIDYLKGNNLTEKLIHSVLYVICMSDINTPLEEGISKAKQFLKSLGRYGNTAFLFPMYGCGEIPQCFCRLCAVFGGIYCLARSVDGINIIEVDGERKIHSIKCGNQEIKTTNLVVNNSYIPKGLDVEEIITKKTSSQCGGLARAIFITSTPIGNNELNSGGGGVNFLRLLGEDKISSALVIQLSYYSGTCPKGLYLIHFTGKQQTNDPKNDLKPFVDQIFDKEQENFKPPEILYSVYFHIPRCKKCENVLNENLLPKNLHFACGPYFELDYDLSIENAQEIFTKLYPDETFLPRAPDPEEIIIGDEDPTAVKVDNIIDDINEGKMSLEDQGNDDEKSLKDQNEENRNICETAIKENDI